MKKKKIIGIVLMVIFIAAAIVSGVMFARQYSDAKANVDTFDELAGLVVDIETPVPELPTESDEPAELTEEELRAQQAALCLSRIRILLDGSPLTEPISIIPSCRRRRIPITT